jgi:hypothetical protein
MVVVAALEDPPRLAFADWGLVLLNSDAVAAGAAPVPHLDPPGMLKSEERSAVLRSGGLLPSTSASLRVVMAAARKAFESSGVW